MTPQELLAAVADVAGNDARATESFGLITIDVAADRWVSVATALRDLTEIAAGFFDWLSAYDDKDAGIAVVVHVWSLQHRHSIALRTRVSRQVPELMSLTSVWPGADWHERETFEMFGINFVGHPKLVPLLLPDGFEGHPLRKEFVLASRVAKVWPGAKEPGQTEAEFVAAQAKPARRRRLPPGVPDPVTWGPDATQPTDGRQS